MTEYTPMGYRLDKEAADFDRWLAKHDAELVAKRDAAIKKALEFLNRGLIDSAEHVLTQVGENQ